MWKKQKNIFHFFAEKKRIRKKNIEDTHGRGAVRVVVRTWAVVLYMVRETSFWLKKN
jgi:hypothetical protein